MIDGVPEDFDLTSLNSRLLELQGVLAVHDLHVWALSTTSPYRSNHAATRSNVILLIASIGRWFQIKR